MSINNGIEKTFNNSIVKAFDVLNAFTESKSSWGVRELAKHLNANQSTTYRLMATLESLGMLNKDDEHGKYSLGLRLYELGNRVKLTHSLIRLTHPELEKIAQDIRETVHLGVLKNANVYMIDKMESPMGLKLNSVIGSTSPLYCTGIGKVLLAFEEEEEQKELIHKMDLRPHTSNTICDKNELKANLNKIKKQGYALDNEEKETGLICVAVPVFNEEGEIVAGLSAAGPSSRFREDALPEYLNILKSGAERIRQKIGNYKHINLI